jgi:hypothetical protein
MAERPIDDDLAADRVAFFQAAAEGFRRAERAVGAIEKCYLMAGFNVRLRFAGPALIPFIDPALAHLATANGAAPAYTIELFDTASTGTPMPLLVKSLIDLIRDRWWEHLHNRREIRDYHGGTIQTAFHLGPGILSVLNSTANHALYWVQDAHDIPYYERGYPLTNLLNWWLGRRGRVIVHAAGVGRESGGVLLPGKGGSGKSTTALACAASDLAIVGDDYCAVDPAMGCAHSLYNTVKLKGDEDVERFAPLEGFSSNVERVGEGDDRARAMVFLHRHFPGTMRSGMPIRAILIPRVTGQPETTIAPASAAGALKALAPSTIFQLAGNERPAFQAMVQLARNIPAFEISLGTRIPSIPAAIARFLDTLPEAA